MALVRARSPKPGASPRARAMWCRAWEPRGRARPELGNLRVWPQHPPMQGLRVERDAAVPLAVQLLSEPFAGPGRRLDGRDLRALGRSARCNHPCADLLVPVAEPAETHDRPDGLRRWRQPRSELDARQEGRRGEAHRAKGLGLPETPGRAGVWRRRAWRRGRRRVAPP